jgi:hypothetical protein
VKKSTSSKIRAIEGDWIAHGARVISWAFPSLEFCLLLAKIGEIQCSWPPSGFGTKNLFFGSVDIAGWTYSWKNGSQWKTGKLVKPVEIKSGNRTEKVRKTCR